MVVGERTREMGREEMGGGECMYNLVCITHGKICELHQSLVRVCFIASFLSNISKESP